jgi:hypothetical protein
MPERQEGAMRPSYDQTVEEMGGAPAMLGPVTEPGCAKHHDYWFGIFRPAPGHAQGDGAVTDAQLVGYIMLERNGAFAHYRHILGHGDFLQDGIMLQLQLELMEWVYKTQSGLEVISYAGWTELPGVIDTRPGLTTWKKKTLFEPRLLMETVTETPEAQIAELISKTENRPFPEWTLDGASSAACIYSAALFGQRDVIHMYRRGIQDVTLVDHDTEMLVELQKVYPDSWSYLTADAFAFIQEKAQSGDQYDVTVLDPWVYLQQKNVDILPDVCSPSAPMAQI